MDWEIIPYIGIDSLKLGMTRQEVREHLNSPYETFQKGEDSDPLTDAFDALGLHVFYDVNDKCDAFEFYDFAPTFLNRPILKEPFNKVRDWFFEIDKDTEVEDVGFTSYKYGIGVYAPGIVDSESAPIEGVIVFVKGLYDKM